MFMKQVMNDEIALSSSASWLPQKVFKEAAVEKFSITDKPGLIVTGSAFRSDGRPSAYIWRAGRDPAICRRSDSIDGGPTRPVAEGTGLVAHAAIARNCPVIGRVIG